MLICQFRDEHCLRFQDLCLHLGVNPFTVTLQRSSICHLKAVWKSCCSVTQSCPTLCDPMDMPSLPVLHHLPELAQTHVHWVGDAIQPSHPLLIPFSSCLQSFPASGSFPMSWLFTSGGQKIGASASASLFPMNIQYWFPLGLTGSISLPAKGLSRVFSSATVQKHWFFSAQLSLWSNSHIHTWLLKTTIALTRQTFVRSCLKEYRGWKNCSHVKLYRDVTFCLLL